MVTGILAAGFAFLCLRVARLASLSTSGHDADSVAAAAAVDDVASNPFDRMVIIVSGNAIYIDFAMLWVSRSRLKNYARCSSMLV